MGIKIVPLSIQEITDFFLNDPSLALLGLSDEEIAFLYKGEYKKNLESNYIAFKKDDTIIGVGRYEYFTNSCLNVHLYVPTKFHKTPIVVTAVNEFKNYIKNKLKINKIIVIAPSSCTHIHKFVPKIGFKQEGLITNSFTWRLQPVDLHIYGLDLTDYKHKELMEIK